MRDVAWVAGDHRLLAPMGTDCDMGVDDVGGSGPREEQADSSRIGLVE